MARTPPVVIRAVVGTRRRRTHLRVGLSAQSPSLNGPPVPALAQAAEQEGKRAASNLAAEIENKVPVPFRYRSVGQLVDLGEGSALVDILGVNLSGLLGAYVWKAVYLYELDYDLNRAHVLADWTIDLFTRPDTSKQFEDPNQPRVRT